MNEPYLNVDILSDIHLTTSVYRRALLKKALLNIKNNAEGAGLFISLGDTTDHGNKDQWFAFQQIYESIAPSEHTIIALGNHDTWTEPYSKNAPESEFLRSLPLYCDCRRKLTGYRSDLPYYSRTICGVPFLVLGTSDSAVGALVDDAQIEWFREELKKAATLNTFIFVVSHWALMKTHGLPYTFSKDRSADDYEGTLGDGGEILREEMKKYRNVILLSGHSHMGWRAASDLKSFGFSSVEGAGGIISINLPCFTFPNHDGRYNHPGLGLRIAIRGNRADFIPMNYLLDLPLPNESFSIYT